MLDTNSKRFVGFGLDLNSADFDSQSVELVS